MLSLFALRSLSTHSCLVLCAFYLCRRSLKCAPKLWPLSKSTCKGPKRWRARRPKSSSSLLLSSTWCRRTNPSTSPDRPVEAAGVLLLFGGGVCAQAIQSAAAAAASRLALYTGSRLSVDTGHIIRPAPLTNSAAFAQISTTSKCLHNAEPQLENFRNHIFIQRAEEQGVPQEFLVEVVCI